MASRPSPFTPTYRIVSHKCPPFDGAGTFRWGSRWIGPGRRVIHTAHTYSLAVLENLVHWQTSQLPPTLVCVEARIPDALEQEELSRKNLPPGDSHNYAAFQEIGNDWYDHQETAVLWVPSLISPFECNVLLNQRHKDFKKIRIGRTIPAQIDSRLITVQSDQRK